MSFLNVAIKNWEDKFQFLVQSPEKLLFKQNKINNKGPYEY